MDAEEQKRVARALAHNRAAGVVSHLSLGDIRDAAEASAIQSAAIDAFATDVVGYTLVGTNEGVRRSLGLDEPIVGIIAQGSVLREDQGRFRIPNGFIGAQCEFVFTIGPISTPSLAANPQDVEKSVLGCQPAIGLLGRRTARPSGHLGAVADYSLHVATICGRYSQQLSAHALGSIVVRASIDGNEMVQGSADTIMGHPLNAIAWLTGVLHHRGTFLNSGDIVATGSCATILQVLPGQRLDVDFGPIGRVSCDFE